MTIENRIDKLEAAVKPAPDCLVAYRDNDGRDRYRIIAHDENGEHEKFVTLEELQHIRNSPDRILILVHYEPLSEIPGRT